MRWTLLVTVFAFGLWPADVLACDCDVPPIAMAIERANVVATGRITRLEWIEASGVIQVEIAVAESLKGTGVKGQFVAYTRPYGVSCFGYDFRVGRDYLVFASRPQPALEPINLPTSGYLVGLCGGTTELGQRQGNQRLTATKEALKRR
jgi:hypothetical protein